MENKNKYKSRGDVAQEALDSGILEHHELLWIMGGSIQQRTASASAVSTTSPILQKSNGGNVRRIERNGEWSEYKDTSTGPQYRDSFRPVWQSFSNYTIQEAIDICTKNGWKEVFSGFDPNDLQKPCCGGGSNDAGWLYTEGAWHALDCSIARAAKFGGDYVDANDMYGESVYKAKKCECGASHTPNPNCHSTWCGAYKK